MKKYDNFIRSLSALQRANFEQADYDEIYRTGVVGQFNLTFELAWKCLQSVLQMHSVAGAETGSPREILKLGYQMNFLQDADVWLLMLKKRNLSVHIYDEEQIDELIILIRDSFVPAFLALAETIKDRIAEAESNTWE
ncbi:MAG: HI0074 family nucleotidyltransferase substrate-binding subunit [Oscillospiraceae bacterium]|nr:HI0074 family nucleotidyltransferase substrate-binding subunit [Oscillospiraceae bacterium]